jgi:hypothetical protein
VVLCDFDMMKDLTVFGSYTKMHPDATNCDFTLKSPKRFKIPGKVEKLKAAFPHPFLYLTFCSVEELHLKVKVIFPANSSHVPPPAKAANSGTQA